MTSPRAGCHLNDTARSLRRSVPLILIALAASSCGTDAGTDPPWLDASEVSIRIRVTGGLAGVDYSLVLDGARSVLLGEACVQGCDFSPGEVLAAVLPLHVATAAARLESAGILSMDGRDFGSQCCDQADLTLSYRRGTREATVRGSSEALPPEVREVANDLMLLMVGTRRIIVAFGSEGGSWPRDPYRLGRTEIVGDVLSLEVHYGGGCHTHRFDLVAWDGWLESFPVQTRVLLAHDDLDDPCDAALTEWLPVDLAPLRRSYRATYGESQGPTTIILRLWDPLAANPLGVRLIEYVF